MSVLTCPVCQGEMKEISRNGILIDSCTRCRGVWLDRGELEKLSAAVASPEAQGGFLGGALSSALGSDRHRRRDYDDDYDRRHGYDQRYKKRKSLLYFFD